MRRRHLWTALAGAVALHDVSGQVLPPAAPAAPSTPAPPPIGEVRSLGGDRFQVGRIVVDKRARRFTVPGRIQALDKPLEYLATTPTGRRAYEALLALDGSGSEMNLACILIGLERDPKVPSSRQLTQPGPPVLLSVAWTDASGQRRVVTAAEALLGAEAGKGAVVEWAYTGSFTSIDGSQLAADHTGSLISFVKKDATGVIEAVSGASLGAYGTVRGSTGLPPEGSAIELIVEAPAAAK
jgi:hypothetical protein